MTACSSRKRLVKSRTKRFRGNVTDTTAEVEAIWRTPSPAADEDASRCSLTTWEARNLSAWLRGAVGEGAARRRHIAFTEPNMAFGIEHRRAGRVRLEVRLSHEALPTWVPRDHAGWQAGDVLILDIGREDLAPAAEVWDREYEQFPER
jgi:hypothetical protein